MMVYTVVLRMMHIVVGNDDDDANDDSCGEKGDNAYRLSVSRFVIIVL
jgi:hypothetical protein